MRTISRLRWLAAIQFIGALNNSSAVLADTPSRAVSPQLVAGIGVERALVAGGGDISQTGAYRLSGSIGQSIAEPTPATVSGLAMQSGFWSEVAPAPAPEIFRDDFE